MKVGERLYDPPHIEHEVERKPHESARCGRSAERSGYRVVTLTSCNDINAKSPGGLAGH